MKWSRSFIPTLKEDPQEAEAISHKLMVRAGLIRRLSAGAYTYLPLGFRALQKAKNIILEEMDAAGAVQLMMPALQPTELWHKTGRYDLIGDVMIKFRDRHGKEVALGPTHEEIITDLVSKEVRSYKDLPVILYQIQTKFRDELRPRFGIVRSCEFIMKDAYSFDVDADGLEKSYKAMFEAYCRIFERCKLPYMPVEADSGMMGGNVSHEFMVPSEIGEDRIAVCPSCGYSASLEVAEVRMEDAGPDSSAEMKALEIVDTPGKSSVKDVSAMLKVSQSDLAKAMVYMADNDPVVILIRGDHEANESKIKKALSVTSLALAEDKQIVEYTRGAVGFSGPIGLDIPVYADNSVKAMKDFVAGANEKDKHVLNVNHQRDFRVVKWIDARVITSDDACPRCGNAIEIKNSIEIGHTFKLGTKYSDPLNATFLDSSGETKKTIMGCYGIGVNRILASLIETNSDDNGIIWPLSLAPYHVVIIPLGNNDDPVMSEAERVYGELIGHGVEVILDDREGKSPGVRFKDADLIGFPLQVVIGKKSLASGKLEIKQRKTGERTLVDTDKGVDEVLRILKDLG